MSDDRTVTESARAYASANAAHYSERDLAAALQLYKKIMACYASTREAGYSRMQILNIAHSLVPAQELLDAQVELALARLEHPSPSDPGPASAVPLAPELVE